MKIMNKFSSYQQELVNLLPGVSVHIDMVGKSISKNCRRKTFQDGQLSCALFREDYHSWEGHEADIIIGKRAFSWLSKLTNKKQRKTFFFVNDSRFQILQSVRS